MVDQALDQPIVGKPAGRAVDHAVETLKVLEATEGSTIRFAALTSAMQGVFAVAQAAVAAYALGKASQGISSAAVAWLALSYLGLTTMRVAIDLLAGRIAFVAAQSIVGHARADFIRRQGKVSPFATDRFSSAAGASLIAEKLDLLIPYYSRFRLSETRARIVPLMIVTATASVSWVMALLLLVTGPLIPLFMALIGVNARELSEKHLAEVGSLNSLLLERLHALADIRILDGRRTMLSQFAAAAESLRSRTMGVLRVAFLSSTVLELFAALGVALSAVYVGFSLLGVFSFGTYGHALTFAQGVFLLLLAPEFFLPLREFAAGWHDRAAALAVVAELDSRNATDAAVILGDGGPAPRRLPSIGLRGVGLKADIAPGSRISYPDFEVARGEAVAVTGPSGSGKTLLLAMIAGLVRPSAGAVVVDGRPLSDETADAWRGHLAWIPQKPRFLDASLRRNICLDGSVYDHERLIAALRDSGSEDIVSRLPRGILTRLGEDGGGVSGGEARRLLVARALYSGADVIVADEPTADLDRQNADLVSNALMVLARRGHTLLIATHDPRLVALMDREIRLEGKT